MFEALGLLVDLFERVGEHFVQKCFDEAMMAQHLESPSLACR
jgi:hypothetical protein